MPNYQWYAKPSGGYNWGSVEETNNAMMIYSILSGEGWTVNAIAGAVGNMRHESGLNPWRWEGDWIWYPDNTPPRYSPTGEYINNHGYGLVQYTPNGKYTLSPTAQSLPGFNPNYQGHDGNPNDGTAQMLFTSRFGDWIKRDWAPPQYQMYYDEFKQSTASAELLARVWLWCYEYPGNIEGEYIPRSQSAAYFYELFTGEPPEPPPPTPIPPYIPQRGRKIPYMIKSWKIP